MRKNRIHRVSVNTGSMADIAFLLLIFFLVTTTISTDKGILRKLPAPCPDGQTCETEIRERNILRVYINHKEEIMIEDNLVAINDIKDIIKDFIDNNGDKSCTYCNGISKADYSDNPKKAVVSLQHASELRYEIFINVQDEITKAYYELREDYANKVFNKAPSELTKEEMKQIKAAYPFILSEAKTR
ncbi:biopolymer transporter ExbD [Winogradskyella sp. 3972H.M.0a.05]|uniref:ExbD/TolR family protein n=1 Tax=Winogradskyella sp. 3972H.M.0a.05 TaxID=2950277 RepID=UPI0033936493